MVDSVSSRAYAADMSSLPLELAVVDECRVLAQTIADSVHRFIDAHTTVSIERTVLRAYGVQGIDEQGVPLVNRCVERARERNVLHFGIATLLASVLLRREGASIQEAAEELAFADGFP